MSRMYRSISEASNKISTDKFSIIPNQALKCKTLFCTRRRNVSKSVIGPLVALQNFERFQILFRNIHSLRIRFSQQGWVSPQYRGGRCWIIAGESWSQSKYVPYKWVSKRVPLNLKEPERYILVKTIPSMVYLVCLLVGLRWQISRTVFPMTLSLEKSYQLIVGES